MRSSIFGLLLFAISLGAVAYTVDSLNLMSSAEASGEKEDPLAGNPHAGLWREGKAVFSDIAILDIFTPAPFAKGYKPKQPIDYSHVLHVQQNQIECTYCHSGVTKSSFATVPSLETCMGCHSQIKKDSEQIKILQEHWDAKKPIEWVPVTNLPEHVQFNHQRHMKAGVSCQTCHGQVQEMEVVERASSLKMGFCVSCHRENGASIDCGVCHY